MQICTCCSRSFEKPEGRGRPPLRCPECRAGKNVHHVCRTIPGKTQACYGCEKVVRFQMHGSRLWCAECAWKQAKAAKRKWWHDNKHRLKDYYAARGVLETERLRAERQAAWDKKCEICSIPLAYRDKPGRLKYCPQHAKEMQIKTQEDYKQRQREKAA